MAMAMAMSLGQSVVRPGDRGDGLVEVGRGVSHTGRHQHAQRAEDRQSADHNAAVDRREAGLLVGGEDRCEGVQTTDSSDIVEVSV